MSQEVNIKDSEGKIMTTLRVHDSVDYAEKYKEAKDHIARLECCLKVLSDIIDQQQDMKMSPSVNLNTILAVIADADIESTDVLLKPMAKACRKALNRNRHAMGNYEIMARKQLNLTSK